MSLKLKTKILDLLYPQGLKCAVCKKEAIINGGACEACRAKLRAYDDVFIPAGLEGFTAGFIYNEEIRSVIHRFKYDDEPYLAHFLADSICIPKEWRIDILVPVPLHPKRLKERGCNQSELLARELSRGIGIHVETELLHRIRETGSQTELSEAERRRNVENAFRADKGSDGKTILLIDDVCTTGSTLSECAKTLKNAGACAVYGASAAAVVTGNNSVKG